MMLLRRKSLLGLLCALTVVTLMWASPVVATTEEVEIAGTVYASEWDANDNVTAVVIATDEGEEIAVLKAGKGAELLKLEEKNVRATGQLATDNTGKKTITVNRYVIQKESEGSF